MVDPNFQKSFAWQSHYYRTIIPEITTEGAGMARGDLIKKLLESYGNEKAFFAAAEQIISEEESKKNLFLARTLRKSLDKGVFETDTNIVGRTSSANHINSKPRGLMPLSVASEGIADFLEYVDPEYSHKDVILSPDNTKILSDLIKEYRGADKIRKKGLPIRTKLLFCGPPGCGKTLTASVFSSEIGLPLYVVKIDRLMSSFLGETATNIRKVFEFAKKHQCILFLDEFDAVARARDDVSEHSELRRVVNSLLLFIDRLNTKGFLIAATNYEKSLDYAIWRRFDEVIWFEKPTLKMTIRFLKRRFKNIRLDFLLDEYVKDLEGYSYAELERMCIGALRNSVVESRDYLSRNDFEKSWRNEERKRKHLMEKRS